MFSEGVGLWGLMSVSLLERQISFLGSQKYHMGVPFMENYEH